LHGPAHEAVAGTGNGPTGRQPLTYRTLVVHMCYHSHRTACRWFSEQDQPHSLRPTLDPVFNSNPRGDTDNPW